MAKSLQGHEADLANLANPNVISKGQLDSSIGAIDEVRRVAVESGIARQAEVATRLLAHFQFEQAMREGLSAADFRILSSQDSSELEVPVAESVAA